MPDYRLLRQDLELELAQASARVWREQVGAEKTVTSKEEYVVVDSPKIHHSFTHLSPDFPIVATMRRAFVIQLYSEADLYPEKFVGRVEHVDSGRADGFRSVEELVKFIEQTVEQIDETARREMQEPHTEP